MAVDKMIYFEVWAHKTSITLPHISFYLNVCTKPGKCTVMYICVKGINFASVPTILMLDFEIVPIMWCFCFSFF